MARLNSFLCVLSFFGFLASDLPSAIGKQIPGVKTTYEVLQTSDEAAVVERGSKVTVHATGTVKSTRKQFWSTKDAGQRPFEYKAGVGGVIKGWDQGCLGMKKGEIRKLEIPADEGYGTQGFPAWGIPPDSELIFEIEVLKIKPPPPQRRTRDGYTDRNAADL
mmetsp:Transcript_36564/g.70208  ORF Transcript_36564/g.70208 Transcript_36564/m.70208 type:complete len:163 (-) Transcript_36564:556-1044(-)